MQGHRKGKRIQQRHVRPLAKLRAGPVRGVADMDQPFGKGAPQRAVAVAGRRQVCRSGKRGQKRRDFGPKGCDLGFPGGDVALVPIRKRGCRKRPEDGGKVRPGRVDPPKGQNAGHAACAMVALDKHAAVKAAAIGPGHGAPDRAKGQRAGHQRRQAGRNPCRVHHKIEGPIPGAFGHQPALVLQRGRDDAGIGGDRRPRLQCCIVKRCKQGRAMDGKPVARAARSVALPIIAHVKDGAAPGNLNPPHCGDRLTKAPGRVKGTATVKHGLPDRLDHQTRPNGARCGELIEDLDPVPGACQQRRSRKPTNSGPDDGDGLCDCHPTLANHPPRCPQGRPFTPTHPAPITALMDHRRIMRRITGPAG